MRDRRISMIEVAALKKTGEGILRGISAALATLHLMIFVLLLPRHPITALLLSAALCGWAEVDGYCGASHFSSLTPLTRLTNGRRLWWQAIVVYTTGGMVTAAVVGLAVGALGWPLQAALDPCLLVIACLAAVLCAREVGLCQFWLPQIAKQTNRMWAAEFGFIPGAFMWGAHIGLGVATVVKHGGLYIVVAAAALVGPKLGALVMVAFWIGRALPMFGGPVTVAQTGNGEQLHAQIVGAETALRFVAIVGLATLVASLYQFLAP